MEFIGILFAGLEAPSVSRVRETLEINLSSSTSHTQILSLRVAPKRKPVVKRKPPEQAHYASKDKKFSKTHSAMFAE